MAKIFLRILRMTSIQVIQLQYNSADFIRGWFYLSSNNELQISVNAKYISKVTLTANSWGNPRTWSNGSLVLPIVSGGIVFAVERSSKFLSFSFSWCSVVLLIVSLCFRSFFPNIAFLSKLYLPLLNAERINKNRVL